jgi:riboflavin synthase
MFTGIIEAVGEVRAVRERERLREIDLVADAAFLNGVEPGDSVALDGACLTPVRVEERGFTVEAVGTTLSRTLAAGYRTGSRVNLEKALALGDRLDGHLVQGHVDGVGELIRVRDDGDYRLLDVRIPEEVFRTTILHGSIALNGVSLTVNELEAPDRTQVAIIPHTWSRTNLSDLRPGDPLNVEGDLIGKYVGKLVGRERPKS